MRYMVVGLNYGCEVTPVLSMLRVTFPEVTFTDERSLHGTFSSSWAIYVSGAFDARELERMRSVGVALRDGFQKGFMVGWDDHARTEGRRS